MHVHELRLAQLRRRRSPRAGAAAAARPGPAPTRPSCTPSARGSRRSPAARASRCQAARSSPGEEAALLRARSGRSPRRRSPRSRRGARPRPSRRTRRAARRQVAASRGLRNVEPGLRRGQVELGRPGPPTQQRLGALDRGRDPLDDRVAVLGVADRVGEHLVERPRPELLEQQEPAAERAGDARRLDTGARDEDMAARPKRLDRRACRARRPGRRGRAASPASAGQKTAGRSPPGPFRCGSTTCSTNPAAQAASNALPPRSSTAMPVCVASQCVDATAPNVPRSSGRVVKLRCAPSRRRRGRGSSSAARTSA